MDYSYSYSANVDLSQVPPWMIVVWLVVVIFYLYCGWRLFEKAGKPGWASIIPIYNLFVFLDIVGKSYWWILLLLIPFVNFIAAIILMYNLALRFGKGVGYTLGLIFLGFIFMPILALGSAKYTPASK